MNKIYIVNVIYNNQVKDSYVFPSLNESREFIKTCKKVDKELFIDGVTYELLESSI